MPFYADLHIHSKYSRATSGDLDLPHLALWAKKKGVTVVGTGDFTHPAWLAEIREQLVPAEPGLFRLRADLEAAVAAELGPCAVAGAPVRFHLEVEISTIYKQGDRVRKVHHLLYAPDLAAADRMVAALARVGNIASDGRPILGLPSRDLLEICLAAGDGCYLVPAHIWTPWFSVFGSKSGFDRLDECYGDLSPHIFALETGLSSDPPMNWRLSMLDGYRLVSNSDAHSPPNLGREACRFDGALDYFAIRRALATGAGYGGTVEFFPEEGKYHLDGHRACGFRCVPDESRRLAGKCPVCGGPLTLGVDYRVHELADRAAPQPPPGAAPFRSLVPLAEVIGEIQQCGAKTKTVQTAYEQLVARLGPELFVLAEAPLDEIGRVASPLLVEGVRRMRAGQVIREGGYDGEYGTIRLFHPGELDAGKSISLLFDLPEPIQPEPNKPGKKFTAENAEVAEAPEVEESPSTVVATETSALFALSAVCSSPLLSSLDPDQRGAAGVVAGPLLIVAGPGTGKTRTLTHRLAHLIDGHGVAPEACLAITFTRRAAGELRERLAQLLPDGRGAAVSVMTFHGLGLTLLREWEDRLGLGAPLRVADEREVLAIARDILGLSLAGARELLGDPAAGRWDELRAALRARGGVTFDDLVRLPVELLTGDPRLAARCHARWLHVSVDEFQDVDPRQYALVRLLTAADLVVGRGLSPTVGREARPTGSASLCVIGDPDQAIYGFRGTDVRFFQQFQADYPAARVVALTRNYRSTHTIVGAALQAVAPTTLVRERTLRAQAAGAAAKLTLRECATERAEAEFVVHTIEQLVGGTSLASFDTGRASGQAAGAHTFGDFAVLYRTAAQTPALIEAFARSGIPFQKRAHTPLAEHPAVVALLARIQASSADLPLAERLETVANEMARAETPDADLPRLLLALRPLAAKHGAHFAAFRDELALGVDVDLWDPRAEHVSLLTLHAAKGLEFRVLFLVGCEDGLLPHRFSFDPAEEVNVAEERRLFFVGLTRARERLFLTHARRRHWQGEVRDRRPSPFLTDIADALIIRQRDEPASRPVKARQLEMF
jgi:DNA helicase-2/ATP-dependent DNA helicase PcrA